jgi:hypothetical protein
VYKVGKSALAHSTYVRKDRKQVMRFCAQLAESEGQTLSRFLTDIVLDYLEGNLVYRQELRRKIARRAKK